MNQETYFATVTDRLEACESLDEVGTQISDFLCQVLNTVLLDGAVRVTDLAGEIASIRNNYLMAEDGSEFSGLVTTAAGVTSEFSIFEKPNGVWAAEVPCALVR